MDNAINTARKMDTETLKHVRRTLDREVASMRGLSVEGACEMALAIDTVLCERCNHE